MELLQTEGIRGADLVFACVGPALEIFSRYSRVETAEGREVTLAEYLEKVWEVVGRIALEQVLGTAEARNGIAGALEEDARLIALFLWALQSTNGNDLSRGRERVANDDEEEPDDTEDDDDKETPRTKPKGYSLIFDVVRRFVQLLGIHLPDWEGRIIETKKGVVPLLSVSERTRQLFGEGGAKAVVKELERSPSSSAQLKLFPDTDEDTTLHLKGRKKRQRKASTADISDEVLQTQRETTTLDRVHAAMLLQKRVRTNALRALLRAGQECSPDFLRLANALSVLYPLGTVKRGEC
jgi:nitrogen fixation-related uncharacterized protein